MPDLAVDLRTLFAAVLDLREPDAEPRDHDLVDPGAAIGAHPVDVVQRQLVTLELPAATRERLPIELALIVRELDAAIAIEPDRGGPVRRLALVLADDQLVIGRLGGEGFRISAAGCEHREHDEQAHHGSLDEPRSYN